jgi:hypothetical protein
MKPILKYLEEANGRGLASFGIIHVFSPANEWSR